MLNLNNICLFNPTCVEHVEIARPMPMGVRVPAGRPCCGRPSPAAPHHAHLPSPPHCAALAAPARGHCPARAPAQLRHQVRPAKQAAPTSGAYAPNAVEKVLCQCSMWSFGPRAYHLAGFQPRGTAGAQARKHCAAWEKPDGIHIEPCVVHGSGVAVRRTALQSLCLEPRL